MKMDWLRQVLLEEIKSPTPTPTQWESNIMRDNMNTPILATTPEQGLIILNLTGCTELFLKDL